MSNKLAVTSHSENNTNAEKKDKTIFIIFISLLCDLLAFTIILPLLPSILEHYKNNDSSGLYKILTNRVLWFQEMVGAPERYISVLFGGFLGSMFSFLQFLVSPIVGGLSDYYGRKPVLLICASGIVLSYILWACSSNFAIFILARFVGGLSKGNVSLCMSIITDVSTIKTRGRGMALVGVAFSLGFIIGPFIGAMFAIYSTKTTYWFVPPSLCAVFLAICDLVILASCLRESLPKEKRKRNISSAITYGLQFLSTSAIFRFAAIQNVRNREMNSLRSVGLVYFLHLFLYSGLEFTVTFLMYHKFEFTSIDQAKMFMTIGIIMALIQGTIVRRIPNTETKRYAVFSLYLIAPAFILVGLAEQIVTLYIGMILFAISTAFSVTCLTTLVSKYGSDDQKGLVIGIFRSLGALARATGPILGSLAYWTLGSRMAYVGGGLLLVYPAFLLQYTEL